MSNLKACPFCGSHRVGLHQHNANGMYFFVPVCGRCHSQGESRGFKNRSEARRAAIDAWNTRAPDPALDELEKWLEEKYKELALAFNEGAGSLEAPFICCETLAKLRELKSAAEKGESND